MSGNPRKNPVSDDELVRAYREGKSVKVIEKELGISATTIYRVLESRRIKRRGLEEYRRKARLFDDAKSLKIRKAYEGGQNFQQLMEGFGGSEHSIKKAIVRAGGKLVPVTPPVTDEEAAEMVALYKGGLSQMQVSLKVKRSQSLVGRVLKKHGVAQRRMVGQTGPKHGRWKGGRTRDASGYIRVWIPDDDPFASLRYDDGQALEHRLVMSRKLGRLLRPDETVHHINGDKTDNRPDNLQLRQGRHGKHIVMHCLDCGSTNVKAAPLD